MQRMSGYPPYEDRDIRDQAIDRVFEPAVRSGAERILRSGRFRHPGSEGVETGPDDPEAFPFNPEGSRKQAAD